MSQMYIKMYTWANEVVGMDELGVSFDANFEHPMLSWNQIRTWLDTIRRFADAA